ncbi:MAG: glycosyltransferase [Acidobacteria bacterium]|nr:MAG: glycosyltransferase [Acidobacteriota bacterium]
MRILFMTQVLPFPLDAGPKVRAHYVLRYLAEAGHEVSLLTFIRPGEPAAYVEPLRRICRRVETVPMVRSRGRDLRDGLRSVGTNLPFLLVRDQLPAMWDRLKWMLRERSFDALHADQLWMAPYAMNGVSPGLTVLDQHNAVFMVPRRMAERHRSRVARLLLRHEAVKLQAFEREACQRFARVVWVTEEDREAVLPHAGGVGARHSVIPIAADPDAQAPVERRRPFRVTFVGGLHWPPNSEGVSWFVENAWPQVARANPSAVLTIVGKAGRIGLRAPGSAERVELTGYVPDLRTILSETSVFIVPLLAGAGMRVKILDAWCWGLPIVSTTIGAEGLDARHSENLLLADEPGVFAAAVTSVFQDGRLASGLAEGGRATVEGKYHWRRVYQAWDRVYPS